MRRELCSDIFRRRFIGPARLSSCAHSKESTSKVAYSQAAAAAGKNCVISTVFTLWASAGLISIAAAAVVLDVVQAGEEMSRVCAQQANTHTHTLGGSGRGRAAHVCRCQTSILFAPLSSALYLSESLSF